MQIANVATLKQSLSSFLHLVEQGEEVLVTSHRRPVARLVPEPPGRLAIRPPTAPMRTLAEVHGVQAHKRDLSAVQALLADRERR